MSVKKCEIELNPGCLETKQLRSYAGMIVCEFCYASEMKAQEENKKFAEQRVQIANNAIRMARVIDNSIQIKDDIFNAETFSIQDLKVEIENDLTISNKPYALASALTERFNMHQDIIFKQSEDNIRRSNEQKAIQVYLNQMSNQLHADEREKLRIANINYKPAPVKTIKPKEIKTAAKKLDKVALRNLSQELGVSEFTIQMLVVQKGLTIEQVGNKLRRNIKEGQSED